MNNVFLENIRRHANQNDCIKKLNSLYIFDQIFGNFISLQNESDSMDSAKAIVRVVVPQVSIFVLTQIKDNICRV